MTGTPHSTGRADASGLERLERVAAVSDELLSGEATPLVPSAAGELGSRPLLRLLEIARQMPSKRDEQELCTYVGERLGELFDAGASFVVLLDEDGRERGRFSHAAGDDEPTLSESLLAKVLEQAEPFSIDNSDELLELRGDSILELRLTSVLCAPLFTEGRTVGVLLFDRRGETVPFTTEDGRLLSLFAGLVAGALRTLSIQERLARSDRLHVLGKMAAGIAHEFNNALFVGLGLCEVLLERERLEPDVERAVRRIRTCTLDATSIVGRLQVFARGHEGPALEPVDCRPIVEEIPELTRNKWHGETRRRGVSIRVETELQDTPPILATHAHVREVLVNLVFNAVDALEDGGTIRLGCGVRDRYVYLRVEDDGVGMSAETAATAFDPFFTTKGVHGSGLGLSSCWTIADRLGGRIWCESRPGEGTTFWMEVPIAEGAEPVSPEAEAPDTRAVRVLVVEDDPNVLETLCVLFESLGHRVEPFSDPRDALDRLVVEDFDLAVTDLGMPGMTGYEFAERLLQRRPSVPVIVLTGWGGGKHEDAPPNVCAVVPKPATLEALGRAIDAAVGSD